MDSDQRSTLPSPPTEGGNTELQLLAERIKERDQLAESYAHAQWLENGRDLVKAKSIIGHGDFEKWCERELSYSTRTAQKLMRAAEVWGPILETEPSSGLPKPTVVYALSAPSVPKNILDRYAPRVIAGENVLNEVRTAIRQHRDAVKAAGKRDNQAGISPQDHEERVKCKRAETCPEAGGEEQKQLELERQGTARLAALALISTRFGDDLPTLAALVAEAGPGSVFSLDAERELKMLMREKTAPTAIDAVVIASEPEGADVGIINASGLGDRLLPASSARRDVDINNSVLGPTFHEQVGAEMPRLGSIVSPQSDSEKFGDHVVITGSFLTPQSERRPRFKSSRGQPLPNPIAKGSKGSPAGRSRG